jgi:hypothetical protein
LTDGELDLNKLKQYIDELYRQEYKSVKKSMTPPEHYFQFKSPHAMLFAALMGQTIAEYESDQDYGNFEFQDSALKEIFIDFLNQYNAKLGLQLDSQNVESMIVSQWQNNSSQINEKWTALVDQCNLGCQDVGIECYCNYLLEVLNIETVKPIEPLFRLKEETKIGWWIAFDDCVFASELPSKIHTTFIGERSRLHNLNGPAVEYRDGFFEKLIPTYRIEGLSFPEHVIMDPNQITIKEIDEEVDSEKRRILMERFGFERFFEATNCEVIDTDVTRLALDDERTNTRTLVQTKKGEQFLVATDGSTGRIYTMPVFGQQKTCKDAHISISGIDEAFCLGQS